jgi:mannose-6-phosphate isomerase-like protein (cupin superfamily)
MKYNYDNRIILKPWGEEYNIYRNKKKCAITYLKIKKNFSTSLHCHPKKKTGFLIISGTAEVQIGIYKENIKKFKPLSRLIFRPGLFHSIKAVSKKGLYALEFETPYLKKDLVRLRDNYGRKSKEYEGKKFTKNLDSKSIKFKVPKLGESSKYRFNNKEIIIEKTKNLKNLSMKDKNSTLAILDGHLTDKRGQKVISYGEIIKTTTLKILSESFEIIKPLTIMRFSINKNKIKKTYKLN